jgi:tryptophanyl-tRNA synthetase
MTRQSLAQAPDALRHAIGPLAHRFDQHDGADAVLATAATEPLAVVTGFGPTDAPTAGTLSVMLGIVELQRHLAVPTTVVISELGAWNSRNVPWNQLLDVRDQMFAFLRAIGFDTAKGDLRSHLDYANLVRCGRVARFLGRQDFLDHHEDLLELYNDHGLLGSEIGVTIDSLYTVADVLGPIEDGATSVLMVSGIEEAYFTELARLVLARQQEAGELTLGWNATLGALYFRVLEGLAGYQKMSKSIPASSIHLGMTTDQVADRVLAHDEASQRPLLSAIELSSGWPPDEIGAARIAFAERATNQGAWEETKRRFVEAFLGYRDQSHRCAP